MTGAVLLEPSAKSPFIADLEAIRALPETRRLQVAHDFELISLAIRVNPLFGLVPHAKQATYLGALEPIVGFVGGNRCLARGTRVRMADGASRAIETIDEGDLVLGADSHGRVRPVRVLRRYDNGVKPVYAWQFRDGHKDFRIICTKDHKVLLADRRGKVAVGDASMERLVGFSLADPRLTGNVDFCGEMETHDLLVDHPDHLFVLANGAIVSNSGKTYAGVLDDIIQCLDEWALPPWLRQFKRWNHPVEWRVGTVNERTTLNQVLLPLYRKLIPRDQLLDGNWRKAYNADRRELKFANGSVIDFLTYQMDLDAWAGVARHGIRLDEEPRGEHGRRIFDECMQRLVSTGGDMRLTFTPLFGLSWSYYELTKNGDPRVDDEVRVVQVDMDENPTLDEAAKQRALKRLTAEVRQARKSGLWVHFQGQIYPEWDPSVHVIDDHPVPRLRDGRQAAVYVGLDPGRDHPFAIVWGYVHEGRIVILHGAKVRGEGTDAKSIAELIHATNRILGVKPRGYVIDPIAFRENHETGQRGSFAVQLRGHGIRCRPGHNSHDAGFSRVAELLSDTPPPTPPHDAGEDYEPPDMSGVRRLQVMASCSNPDDPEMPGVIEEFPMYRWRQRASSVQEGSSPQEPIKRNDDYLDAIRYLVMSNPKELMLPGEDGDEKPPSDPAKVNDWHRKQLLKRNMERLKKRRAKRNAVGRGV